MTFKIIVDSACGISEEYASKHSISIVPTYFRFGDTSYKEFDMSHDEFIKRLKQGEFATTSLPSPQDFVDLYELYKGEQILSMHLTSKLSGTFNAARTIALDYENITLFDTLSISIGAAYMVHLAVFLRDLGYSIDSVVKKLEKARDLIHIEILIQDINYLKRGGRINLGQYALLGLFNLKPLLNLIDGILIVKGIGFSHNGSLKKIARRIRKKINNKHFFVVVYSTEKEDMNKLIEEVPEILDENNYSIKSRVSKTLLSHTGPDAAGIGIAPHFEYYLD